MSIATTLGRLCGALMASALLSPCALAADSSDELAALAAVDQKWEKAYKASDAETLASLYDENAVLLPPGAAGVSGRAAIRAYLAKDAAGSAKAGISLVLVGKSAGGVSGDMGWQSGSFVVKDKAGKVIDTGKYLSVSMKKGGKWLYVRDAWNSDSPAAPEPAPAQKK